MERDDVAELVPLTPAVFHILLVLAGGDAHGYAIMQEVERVTGGQMRLGPGTLYRSIYQLLDAKLIAPADEGAPPADERRCVYRILPRGLAVARAEAARLANLVRAARSRGLLETKPARPQRRGAVS